MTWEMTLQERYEDGVEAGRKAGLEEGVEIGRQEGIAEGRDQGIEEKLCSLIQKKLEKGKSLEQIADECEETEERVRELIEKLESSGRLKTN